MLTFPTSQHLHRCFAQWYPFPSGSVRAILTRGMEFDLHRHNRTEILPGIVGTAINGTIRLQSDFEVRYSSLLNSYIHHFDIFGSWPAIHAQHAPGNPSHVSHYSHSFHKLMII